MPAQIDLEILQGSTFDYLLTWYHGQEMRAITNVTSTAPAVVTAPAHDLPVNVIPVRIQNVKGMRFPADTLRAQRIDTATFKLLDTDASSLGTYRSGGTLVYNPPVSLVGYSARMHIRKSLADTTVILALTDTDGTIVLGGSEGSIQLLVPPATTKDLTFASAVYDLELESPTGVVTRLLEGKVTLKKEVTREVAP